MQCPIHGQEFKWIAPGISKKTGKPYQGFFVCPVPDCKERPGQVNPPPAAPASQGYQKFQAAGQQLGDKMSRADWDAKEKRREFGMTLGMAFKAAVEVGKSLPITEESQLIEEIKKLTITFHGFLLSQTEGNKPATGRPIAAGAPYHEGADLASTLPTVSYDPDEPPLEAYAGLV